MLQAVLVQRSTWRTVETTCAAFPARLTAEAAARLSGERLAQMIRPCGFAKAKARAIHALAAWFCRYGCDVRRTQDVPGSKRCARSCSRSLASARRRRM